jgi:lactate permease
MALAGVAGGLALLLALGASAARTPALTRSLSDPALRPYAVLIAVVTLQTLLQPLLKRHGLDATVTTGRVSFAVLTSPGISLVVSSLLVAASRIDTDLARTVAKRSWRPVLSIAMFMLTARLLVSSGAIDALTAQMKGYGPVGGLAAALGLGALGGFVTGSGVTGNALFLPSAAAAGEALAAKELFAAICSSAAGHAAMASLPVGALLLTAIPNRTAADDRTTLRWGLFLAAVYMVVLLASGWVQLRWSAAS